MIYKNDIDNGDKFWYYRETDKLVHKIWGLQYLRL